MKKQNCIKTETGETNEGNKKREEKQTTGGS